MRKKFFAILFLGLMTVMGGASVVAYVKSHLQAVIAVEKEVTDVPVVRSFKEQYPFTGEENRTKGTTNSQFGLLVAYHSTADYIVEASKVYTCDINPFSSYIKDAIYFIDREEETEIILNGSGTFVRLENGYFTYLYPYSHPEESWENLRDFVRWLDARGTKYLSLIAADKGDDTYTAFPERVPHGYTRMAEEYRAFHEANGIEYLESRERLIAQNSDFFYWFYKTDHHWNVRAGLLVARETAKKINEMGIEADTNVLRQKNFALKAYPKSFVGSMGRRLKQSDKEDMEVYYPKVESIFHLQIPSMGIDRTGSFANTLIDRKLLSAKESSYSAFLYGDQPLIQIENKLADNSSRALVLKQSKAEVFNPYFAMTIRYLDIIDPRYFDGSIRSFVEQTKPDIVITCVDVPYEGNEKFWILK